MSNFFGLIGRLRFIKRWSLMRNSIEENVAEHSWEVATIVHSLATIGNRLFDGKYDVNAVVVEALFHDVSEVITGDMPTPVKYLSPAISKPYKAIEKKACRILLETIPQELKADYEDVVCGSKCEKTKKLIKAADSLSAYIKCVLELNSGNKEFSGAAKKIMFTLTEMNMKEVDYFLENFIQGYEKNLDELLTVSN